jgi:hypothetical protein
MRKWAAVAVLTAGCSARPLPLPDQPELSVPFVEDLGAPSALRDLAPTGDLAVGRDLSVGDLGSACASFDELTCRAHLECVADDCVPCSCLPQFAGCRAPWAPQAICPPVDCKPSCCQSMNECPFPVNPDCVPVGQSAGCGICLSVFPCVTDADCAFVDGFPPGGPNGFPVPPGPVCDYPGNLGQCPACQGGKGCLQGCSGDTNCRPGQICDSGHHCVPRPCTVDGDCPLQFSCSNGQCGRTLCQTDRDCLHGGYCVNGECFEGYGTCVPYPV